MNEKTNPEEDTEELDEQDGEDQPKSKKKLIIIVAVIALIAIGAGIFFSGILQSKNTNTLTEAELAEKAPKTTYYDLEEFLVNLNNPGKQVNFLKMVITLELPNTGTQKTVEKNLPRIRDTFNVYLRELRNSDLKGSSALHQLREELLLRINNVLDKEDDKVQDILFKSIIAQ